MSNLEDIAEEFNRLSINSSLANSDISASLPHVPLLEDSETINRISQQVSQILNASIPVNTDTSSNTTNMSRPQFKPEYPKCVPDFDGDPKDLHRYLSTCECLIDNFYNRENPDDFQNIFILNSLISKLTGTAKVVVNIQNVDTWEELKDTLRRNFADQRDESCLNRDLVMLRQNPNEQPSQFYDRVLHILNLLCSYIDIHENNTTGKNLKKSFYNELALKTFLSGLREPLGTNIRCMRPSSLAEAMQLVIQEKNIQYFQNMTRHGPNTSQNAISRPTHQSSAPRPSPPNFGQSFLRYPSSTPNFQPFTQRPFNQGFLSRPPSNFNRFPSQPVNIHAPPRFSRPTSNVFRPNQNRTLPPPQPMSITTSSFKPRSFQHPQRFQPSAQNQPKMIFEELYNAECQNQYDQPFDEQHEFYEPSYGCHETQISEESQYLTYDNSQFVEQSIPQVNDLAANSTYDNMEEIDGPGENPNFPQEPPNKNPR